MGEYATIQEFYEIYLAVRVFKPTDGNRPDRWLDVGVRYERHTKWMERNVGQEMGRLGSGARS